MYAERFRLQREIKLVKLWIIKCEESLKAKHNGWLEKFIVFQKKSIFFLTKIGFIIRHNFKRDYDQIIVLLELFDTNF